jgi:hypothetical protein
MTYLADFQGGHHNPEPYGTRKPEKSNTTSNAGPVVGVVGGLAVIAAAVVAIFWFRSRQKRKREYNFADPSSEPFETGVGRLAGKTNYIPGQ